jgi:putative FmdB family regulatory protein
MGRGGHVYYYSKIKEGTMPIYEYECKSCGTIFEAWSSIKNRDSLEKNSCAKCKGTGKRIISKSSFILKGSGWEKDGYTGLSNKVKR